MIVSGLWGAYSLGRCVLCPFQIKFVQKQEDLPPPHLPETFLLYYTNKYFVGTEQGGGGYSQSHDQAVLKNTELGTPCDKRPLEITSATRVKVKHLWAVVSNMLSANATSNTCLV